MPGVDELIKCAFCNSNLKEPYMLPCSHGFCKQCLIANTTSGKITCKTCQRVHPVQSGNIEKAFKPYLLADFFMNFKQDNFPSKHEGEPTVVDGVCAECAPPPNKKDANAPPPPQVKLTHCYHCSKIICDKCRNKHYELQRKDSIKILEKFEEGSFNIKATTEQLIELRKKKIIEYQKLKSDITAKHQEYLQKLKTEEEQLNKQIDEGIKNEEIKIKQSESDIIKIKATHDTAQEMKKKVSTESDVKRLALLSLSLNNVSADWTNTLKTEASKADPSKETKLVYNAPKLKDGILGTFDSKKNDGNIKQAVIPGESKICVIL